MSYIIKNCPEYIAVKEIGSKYAQNLCKISKAGFCEDRDGRNCLLKRIVELCKEAQVPITELADNDIFLYFPKPEKTFANKILNQLEIEECENE